MEAIIQIQALSYIIKNVNDLYDKDFCIYFSLINQKIKCCRFFADLISPKIRNLHFMDETIDSVSINNCGEPEFNVLKHFLSGNEVFLENKDSCEMYNSSDNCCNDIKQILDLPNGFLILLNELGNTQIVQKIVDDKIRNDPKISTYNFFEKYNFHKYFLEDDDNSSLLEYAAKNFQDIIEIIMKHLSLNEIIKIITNDNFKIDTEDTLFNFILDIIEKRGDEFKELLHYIHFKYLSKNKQENYFKLLNPNQMTQKQWNSIVNQIISFDSDYLSNKRSNIIVFEPIIGQEFNGLFSYFIKNEFSLSSNDNPHNMKENEKNRINCTKNGLINVTDTNDKKVFNPTNNDIGFLFDYSTLSMNKKWTLNNQLDGYLQFDFKERSQFCLSHYSLHTPKYPNSVKFTPKNWSVEASNDLENWVVLDKRENDDKVKEYDSFNVYECSTPSKEMFRYIRLYQRGFNHGGDYDFYLSGIEFFGKYFVEQ